MSSGISFSITIGGWDTRLGGFDERHDRPVGTETLSAIGAVGNAYQENTLHQHDAHGATSDGTHFRTVELSALPLPEAIERMR